VAGLALAIASVNRMAALPIHVARRADRVGPYRLLGLLGSGGMAHVYLAISDGPAGFQKLAVLKVLKPAYSDDPDFVAMILEEARTAARLNHANVVQTFDAGEDRGRYYLAMEHLDGQPLSSVMLRVHEGGTFPLALRLRVLCDALAGLHYVHELADYDRRPMNVVHRDFSPQNVFVTFDGQVKLLDFGIAKSDVSAVHTRIGSFKGKVSYMAPEQIRGEELDRRTDVFAAGIVLWELCTGRRLWDKTSATHDILGAVLAGRIPSPRAHVRSLSRRLERACMKALSPLPRDRFSTASEMMRELEAILEEAGDRSPRSAVGRSVTALFPDVVAWKREVIAGALHGVRAPAKIP